MHWAHLEASALGSLCCLPRMEGRKVHSISTLLKMICVFQLSLSLHFYLIYLLLNSCDKNDITLCSWNSPAALAGNYGLYLSRSVSTIQSSWLHNLWTDAVSVIPAAVTSDLKQRLTDTWASISQNHHRWSSWSMDKAITCKHEAKGHHFEHLLSANTLHNQLISEPPTVYRGKHVVSHHFHRSYLKANKVNKRRYKES